MTNDGTWQPPRPGGNPPPPAAPPAAVPPPFSSAPGGQFAPPDPSPGGGGPTGPDAPLTPAGDESGSKGKLVAIVVGVLVLVAAGIFAITRFAGGDSSAGGADSPEAAGQAVLAALEEEDVLGMFDVLLPGERDTLRGPVGELVEELTRLEVLSDDASLSDVEGVDVVFADTAVEAAATNVEDIVNLRLHGTVSLAVDGESLPIGDVVDENVPAADPAETDLDSEPAPFDVPVAAVQEDGRWYLSLFHTMAEAARAEAGVDIPAEGLEPTGGDSPEDAFDAFLDGVESLDLRAIVASLNPNEFQVLQRYGPAFLDDAQQELDNAGVQLTLDEADYDVHGDGDRRSITVTYLSGAITAEGETVPFELEGGCFRATSPDGSETVDSCEQEDAAVGDVLGTDAEVVGELVSTLEEAMADYENPGVVVERVDGTWYLSPLASGSEQILAVLRALDRDELEVIGRQVGDLFDDLMTDLSGTGLDIPGEILEDTGAEPTEASVPDVTSPTGPDATAPDLSVDEEGAPPATPPPDPSLDTSAGDECYAAQTATDAVACYDALVATGELAPSAVPVYLRADECGLAEGYWDGSYYTLSDADFTAAVAGAAPCFQSLVAAGTLADFDLPLELSHPECLEGRNWYEASDDEEYVDRIIACAYG